MKTSCLSPVLRYRLQAGSWGNWEYIKIIIFKRSCIKLSWWLKWVTKLALWQLRTASLNNWDSTPSSLNGEEQVGRDPRSQKNGLQSNLWPQSQEGSAWVRIGFIHIFSDSARGTRDTTSMFSGVRNFWLIPPQWVLDAEYTFHAAEICFRSYLVHCECNLETLASGYCHDYSWLKKTSAKITGQDKCHQGPGGSPLSLNTEAPPVW